MEVFQRNSGRVVEEPRLAAPLSSLPSALLNPDHIILGALELLWDHSSDEQYHPLKPV